MVDQVNHWRQLLRWPPWASQALAAAIRLVALLPLLSRLPRVAVVACLDAAHPLYALVPTTHTVVPVNCVTAPETVVTWTLMLGAALLVHAVLMPLALVAGVVLMRGARRLAEMGRRLLAVVLRGAATVVYLWWRPVPAPIPVRVPSPAHTRINPRRGPPVLS